MNINTIKKYIIFLPWLLATLIVLFLVLQRFPLNGRAQFSVVLNGKTPWFSQFQPSYRVTQAGAQKDGWVGQRISDEPVYASFRAPGIFDELTLTMEARTTTPLIEIGLLRDPRTRAYELHPVWSKELSKGWMPVTIDGGRAYARQKENQHKITEVTPEQILSWGSSSTISYTSDPPAPPSAYVGVALRGSHDFYFIPSGNEINFSCIFSNTKSDEPQNLTFTLSRDGVTLWTRSARMGGEEKRYRIERLFSFKSLHDGVYRLSFRMSDAVEISDLQTRAAHWVIGPSLTLAHTSTIWTNSWHIIKEYSGTGIKERADFSHAPATKPVGMKAPQDVRLIGDAYFSFDPDTLFFPSYRRLTDATNLLQEGIELVITPYEPPIDKNEWMTLKTSFFLPWPQDQFNLILSAPGIQTHQATVDVSSVSSQFSRPPWSAQELMRDIKRELQLIRQRLSL